MGTRPKVTSRGLRLTALDVALAAWLVAWIVIGVLTAAQVRALTDISRTLTTAGVAVEQTGETLRSLEQLPVVGPEASTRARMVIEAGREAQRSGRSSRESIRRLSILLGVAVAVLPSAPLLLYVPQRVRQARDGGRTDVAPADP